MKAIRAWMIAGAGGVSLRGRGAVPLQEHVLDQPGEKLLSLSAPGQRTRDSYAALSTADAGSRRSRCRPVPPCRSATDRTRKLLATSRIPDRSPRGLPRALRRYITNINTYATLYNGVMHRDWFQARARGYPTTLDAALSATPFPPSVVTTSSPRPRRRRPFRRYHQLRSACSTWREYHVSDARCRWSTRRQIRLRRRARVDRRGEARLGPAYQARVRGAFSTLDRRLREPGQAHRRLFSPGLRREPLHADELQRHPRRGVHARPRVAIDAHDAVARDAAVRLCRLHHFRRRSAVDTERSAAAGLHARPGPQQRGRIVLLQHAIDGIVGTFYNQVLFADFELETHRMVERDEPITAEALTGLYADCSAPTGAMRCRPTARLDTWARNPHFYQSPYDVSIRHVHGVDRETDAADRRRDPAT